MEIADRIKKFSGQDSYVFRLDSFIWNNNKSDPMIAKAIEAARLDETDWPEGWREYRPNRT